MRLKLQRETFGAFFAEALPLLHKHKDEIAHFADVPLQVDVDRYCALQESGALRIFTARLDRGPSEPLTLIGYAVFFVSVNPHYRSSLQAIEDVLFVDPEQRKGRVGIELIQFSEQELRRENVQAIYHHVKLAHPALGVILKRLGYEPVEQVFVKRVSQ